jgi:glycosyltransferase involved in cell wall biosynthesis
MIERTNGISFVIPAKNEEQHIADTINAIKKNANAGSYEIIVIDNDSADQTADISRSLGAHVVHKVGGTIGSARNAGVALARYDVIVFIDADVSLTGNWKQEIPNILDVIRQNYRHVTGSHCVPPPDGCWIEKNWFQNFSQKAKTVHLGTGHLIMSHQLFCDINGFDENLRTGEDYDICQRARLAGAEIVNNENLLVVHRDYPKNLSQFIKREIWHGSGDYQTINRALTSKVAISAILMVALHLMALIAFVLRCPIIAIVLISCALGLCLMSSIYKFSQAGLRVVLINSVIFYFYYWGRFFSVKYLFIPKK